MIVTTTAEAVSLLSINRRIQMPQNNVDFQNRELPTNILALLLVTTRTADQPQEGMVVCGAETASAAEPRMISLTRRHELVELAREQEQQDLAA
jgi:hypothetical protein